MKLKITPNIKSNSITVREIKRIANEYQKDLDNFKNISFFEFYNLVRNLKYIPDPKGKETLSRPRYTLQGDWNYPRDCDDKTILLVSKAIQEKIPFRIILSGITPTHAHHVYPEIFFLGKWTPCDATYPNKCVFGKILYKERFRKVIE